MSRVSQAYIGAQGNAGVRERWWAVPGSTRARLHPSEWRGIDDGDTEVWRRFRRAWVSSYAQIAWMASMVLVFTCLPVGALLFWAGQGHWAIILGCFFLAGQLACAGVGVCYATWVHWEDRRFSADPVGYNLSLWGGADHLSPRHAAELLREGHLRDWEEAHGLDQEARETFLALAGEWHATTAELADACRNLVRGN